MNVLVFGASAIGTILSSLMFKCFFKNNVLTRKIMELHDNTDDLYKICRGVCRTAGELGIETPLLTKKEKCFQAGVVQ